MQARFSQTESSADRSVGDPMTTLQTEPPERRPFWPTAIIIFGLSLTAAWGGLLGFGLFELIDYVL
jgi:hypothetical protein